MTSSILVTGGAGFIGSATVDIFVSEGFKVKIIDNLSSGTRKNINKKAGFINLDITKINQSIIKKLKGIDAVVHSAAQISMPKSLSDVASDAKTNIIGSIKVLELCRKLKIKKIVFSSSCAVYGDAKKLPIKEGNDLKALNPYAISKKTVENYLDFYNEYFGMECESLRYANVYGPRQNFFGEAGVVTIFINKLLQNQNPTIFGDGMQTRDFIFVEDVARANVLALKKKSVNGKLNIGTGTRISINSLAGKLQDMMGKKSLKPKHEKPREREIRHISLDITLAKRELGWKPRVEIEEGLNRTIEWFSSTNVQNL